MARPPKNKKLIAPAEEKITTEAADEYQSLQEFKKRCAENLIRWEKKGHIVQLIHEPSGISVSFEWSASQTCAFWNYMLDKLLQKKRG